MQLLSGADRPAGADGEDQVWVFAHAAESAGACLAALVGAEGFTTAVIAVKVLPPLIDILQTGVHSLKEAAAGAICW